MLSHMVVKPRDVTQQNKNSLRVVLSHMVVKPDWKEYRNRIRLRVVLSHMVVKLVQIRTNYLFKFESSVISYGSQTYVDMQF